MVIVLAGIVAILVIVSILVVATTSGLSPEERHRLEDEIGQLVTALGRIVPPINAPELRRLHREADYPRMLGWIKNSMRLDLRVGLRIVDTTTAERPMWIETPNPMPAYGSDAFRQTRVIVNVRREVLEKDPFEWIVAGFAHELSHVVLFSIHHKLQHSERAVDLTSMILGYRNFVTRTDRTRIEGGALAIALSLVLLRFGFVYIPGRTRTSLGYLIKDEKRYASRHLATLEGAAG
ncbi:hypothetical protein ACFFWD_17310 [Bradyrhizobium erythrophlei]|uniref:hypothetical protein n=1 Tax=Bradyrhizobium erythrophlei TaxID=1437360 RepID=UPI0035E4EBBC